MSFAQLIGDWHALAVLFVAGVVPNQIWRMLGLWFGGGIDEGSELLVWVRAVATAILAGVIAQIVVEPPGALAGVPDVLRYGAVAAGLVVFLLTRRSIFAGVVTGALTWLLPLSWEWQGTLFAVLTLLAAWLWSKWLRKRVKTQRPADAQLNQRGQQLVGRRLTLDAPLVNGRGHVRVGDSSWPVIADEDFAAGSKVEVIAVEGITLRIRPAVR